MLCHQLPGNHCTPDWGFFPNAYSVTLNREVCSILCEQPSCHQAFIILCANTTAASFPREFLGGLHGEVITAGLSWSLLPQTWDVRALQSGWCGYGEVRISWTHGAQSAISGYTCAISWGHTDINEDWLFISNSSYLKGEDQRFEKAVHAEDPDVRCRQNVQPEIWSGRLNSFK